MSKKQKCLGRLTKTDTFSVSPIPDKEDHALLKTLGHGLNLTSKPKTMFAGLRTNSHVTTATPMFSADSTSPHCLVSLCIKKHIHQALQPFSPLLSSVYFTFSQHPNIKETHSKELILQRPTTMCWGPSPRRTRDRDLEPADHSFEYPTPSELAQLGPGRMKRTGGSGRQNLRGSIVDPDNLIIADDRVPVPESARAKRRRRKS